VAREGPEAIRRGAARKERRRTDAQDSGG